MSRKITEKRWKERKKNVKLKNSYTINFHLSKSGICFCLICYRLLDPIAICYSTLATTSFVSNLIKLYSGSAHSNGGRKLLFWLIFIKLTSKKSLHSDWSRLVVEIDALYKISSYIQRKKLQFTNLDGIFLIVLSDSRPARLQRSTKRSSIMYASGTSNTMSGISS